MLSVSFLWGSRAPLGEPRTAKGTCSLVIGHRGAICLVDGKRGERDLWRIEVLASAWSRFRILCRARALRDNGQSVLRGDAQFFPDVLILCYVEET